MWPILASVLVLPVMCTWAWHIRKVNTNKTLRQKAKVHESIPNLLHANILLATKHSASKSLNRCMVCLALPLTCLILCVGEFCGSPASSLDLSHHPEAAMLNYRLSINISMHVWNTFHHNWDSRRKAAVASRKQHWDNHSWINEQTRA